MSRCRCSSECLCLIRGTDCIDVSGAGSEASPYTVTAILSEDPTNKIQCKPDGLYAGDGVTVYTAESECVTIEGNGDTETPLQALLIVDPDEDNLLACGAEGAKVIVHVDDSGSVQMLGTGTADAPLEAALIFDPSPENMAEEVDGLFVSSHGFRMVTSYITDADSPFVATYNHAIVVDKSGGDVGITLPSIGGPSTDGAIVMVRVLASGANTCAIYGTGGADIDGNPTTTVDSTEAVILVAVNGNWFTFANRN